MPMNQLSPFDAPVPGESLVTSPEQKFPFEKPPTHVDPQEAMEELFLRITDEEVLDDLLDLMRKEMPVEDIAQVILFEGFRTGAFNPDLMLLLIEPTIYILLAMANYAEIDAVLYPEEDFDDDPETNGARSLSTINQLLEGKRMSASAVEMSEDTIQVGQNVVERPEGISQSILDQIRSKVSGGGNQ